MCCVVILATSIACVCSSTATTAIVIVTAPHPFLHLLYGSFRKRGGPNIGPNRRALNARTSMKTTPQLMETATSSPPYFVLLQYQRKPRTVPQTYGNNHLILLNSSLAPLDARRLKRNSRVPDVGRSASGRQLVPAKAQLCVCTRICIYLCVCMYLYAFGYLSKYAFIRI